MNLAPVLGAGLALMFALARRSGGTSQAGRECSESAQAASSRERVALLAWVDCAGRTSDEVEQLAGLLDRARRGADAAAVRARWAARRSVEDAPPTGQLTGRPAAEARAALESPTPPATVPEPPRRRRSHVEPSSSTGRARSTGRVDLAEARRLAPMVARSLRGRSGYRSVLRRFQAAAGLTVDGDYGPASRAALRYFGVADAPPARVATDRPEVYTPPAGAETVAPSEVMSEDEASGLFSSGPVLAPAFLEGSS